jgi:lysine 2,3-aminomutase
VDGGIALASQSVLLKGVNDSVGALADLMNAFLANHIKPYYLHHPDLAPGTSHFRLGIEDGLALMRDLRTRVSGLAMPAYMLDIPGGFGKVPLESDHLETTANGHRVRDHAGRWHDYPTF